MSLTMFSRCEAAALDATHDFSAGDTVWSLLSAAVFNSSAAKIGTNGLQCPSGDDYTQLDAASIINRLQGAVGFWFRPQTLGNGTWLLNLQGTSGSDYINIEYSAGEVALRHRSSIGGNYLVSTTGAGITTGNWYFIQINWTSTGDATNISVWNASGTLLATAGASSAAGISTAPVDIIAVNVGTQGTTMQVDIDNVFIGNQYSDDFFAKRNITSYTEYSAGVNSYLRAPLQLLRRHNRRFM